MCFIVLLFASLEFAIVLSVYYLVWFRYLDKNMGNFGIRLFFFFLGKEYSWHGMSLW